jgi:4-hydroxy-4-methyl-2-oxoglutarate aldolase
MVHITTQIERADGDLIERLGAYTAATIHEAQGRRGALNSQIKPIDRDSTFVGSAFTVVCAPRDNLMLQVAIHFAEPGDVLVISAGEFAEAGLFGDVLGNACRAKGIAAVVTDSGVRDTQELRALGLPVFSGGELIYPGDVIKGDADGIVVVRREEAREVAELSAARDANEAELIKRYWEGGTTIELCNLTEVLKSKGLTTDLDVKL